MKLLMTVYALGEFFLEWMEIGNVHVFMCSFNDSQVFKDFPQALL